MSISKFPVGAFIGCLLGAGALHHSQAHAQALTLPSGNRVTVGDFDGDSKDDLAVGRPDYTVNGRSNAGAVLIYYGKNYRADNNSWFWAGAPAAQRWNQGGGVGDVAETSDMFGQAVAAGDFNGDGIDDLAIGVPGENISNETITDAGLTHILYGVRNTGLQTASPAAQRWTQASTDAHGSVAGSADPTDSCGWALAAGNFNGDFAVRPPPAPIFPADDLAIGCPGEDVPGINNSGAINILSGSSSGLTTRNNLLLDQTQIWNTTNEADDHFGVVLYADNAEESFTYDLFIGVPHKTSNSGMVVYLKGSSGGLTQGDMTITKPWRPTAGTMFGWSIARRSRPGYVQEIWIGEPGHDGARGRVCRHVDWDLEQWTEQGCFTQGDALPEVDDWFGATLVVGDVLHDSSTPTLVAAAPYEDIGNTYDDQGWVCIGAGTGCVETRFYDAGDASRDGAGLGIGLAVGNFDGDADDDLAMVGELGAIRTY